MAKYSPAITVKGLKKYYGDTKAVDGISFEVATGEVFGFLGPNGAGKTTTIRCLMDFLRPDTGTVEILGRDAQLDSAALKGDIGYLSGDVALYENWTGHEHIAFIQSLRGSAPLADELVNVLRFDSTKKIKALSFGNKQKLGLILALMHEPSILILDEPTIGLDPLLQNAVYELLDRFAHNGATVFMSSHNLTEVERVCDRAAIIKDGTLVGIERVSQLRKKKIYMVTVYFKNKKDKKEFLNDGFEIIKEMPDGIVFRVKEAIGPVLKKLSRYSLDDVEITHESLEKIFLEFYT